PAPTALGRAAQAQPHRVLDAQLRRNTARLAGVVRAVEPSPAPTASLPLNHPRQILIDASQQLEQPHVREHALVHCRLSFLFVEKGEHPLGRLFASDPKGALLCSRCLRAGPAASLSYRARDPPPSPRISCSR